MTSHIWHSSQPPHVGWWLTKVESTGDHHKLWRWWDGLLWSFPVKDSYYPSHVLSLSHCKSKYQSYIVWTDYYPPNARVPRINPES